MILNTLFLFLLPCYITSFTCNPHLDNLKQGLGFSNKRTIIPNRKRINAATFKSKSGEDAIDEKEIVLMNQDEEDRDDESSLLDPKVSSQFKILTCSSTSCTKRSQAFGLDEYALFSGLYQRKEEAGASPVEIEESSCLGCCKVGPCVGIEHEDYYGTVALEGMKPNEFNDRVFQK